MFSDSDDTLLQCAQTSSKADHQNGNKPLHAAVHDAIQQVNSITHDLQASSSSLKQYWIGAKLNELMLKSRQPGSTVTRPITATIKVHTLATGSLLYLLQLVNSSKYSLIDCQLVVTLTIFHKKCGKHESVNRTLCLDGLDANGGQRSLELWQPVRPDNQQVKRICVQMMCAPNKGSSFSIDILNQRITGWHSAQPVSQYPSVPDQAMHHSCTINVARSLTQLIENKISNGGSTVSEQHALVRWLLPECVMVDNTKQTSNNVVCFRVSGQLCSVTVAPPSEGEHGDFEAVTVGSGVASVGQDLATDLVALLKDEMHGLDIVGSRLSVSKASLLELRAQLQVAAQVGAHKVLPSLLNNLVIT